jgi:hypothetical protein
LTIDDFHTVIEQINLDDMEDEEGFPVWIGGEEDGGSVQL